MRALVNERRYVALNHDRVQAAAVAAAVVLARACFSARQFVVPCHEARECLSVA